MKNNLLNKYQKINIQIYLMINIKIIKNINIFNYE